MNFQENYFSGTYYKNLLTYYKNFYNNLSLRFSSFFLGKKVSRIKIENSETMVEIFWFGQFFFFFNFFFYKNVGKCHTSWYARDVTI